MKMGGVLYLPATKLTVKSRTRSVKLLLNILPYILVLDLQTNVKLREKMCGC